MQVCTGLNIAARLLLSVPGEGSPRQKRLANSKREQKNPPAVLIVDDEKNVALTLRMVFEDIGYAVTTADSCAAALKILEHRPEYDAVITDLCMEEDQSGLKVAAEASSLHPRPVVLMITGFGTFENVKAAVGSMVDHFALKPLDLDELKKVVARLIALRRDRLD